MRPGLNIWYHGGLIAAPRAHVFATVGREGAKYAGSMMFPDVSSIDPVLPSFEQLISLADKVGRATS